MRSWFTSWGEVPLPLAMRRRRLPFRMSGLRRSLRVMEYIIASIFFMCFSSRSSGDILRVREDMPGIISITWLSGPMRFTWWSCSRKSSRLKVALRIFRSSSWALSRSMFSWALSTSVRTSPIPRMRDAMRSGWKGSRASGLSPVPTYLMGRPVTSDMDRAAPPRASPSSLVTIRPVNPTPLWKPSADCTASWPVMASTTRRTSVGDVALTTSPSSPIISSSMCSRPPVSRMTHPTPRSLAFCTPWRHTWTALESVPSLYTGTSSCRPRVSNCSMAAGRRRSPATSSARWPERLRLRANFAAVVVLPEP